MTAEYDFDSDINNIEAEKQKYLQEHGETFEQLLNARKNTDRTVRIKISGIPLKVYRNLPLDIEEKILAYKKSIEELGEDYSPENIIEAKKPMYLMVATLCAEKPYSDPEFWQYLDIESNGDVSNIFEDIRNAIKKMKK